MGAGTHTTTTKTSAGTNGKWMIAIAGTAVAILVAGVMMQVMRPPPAFPADGAKGTAGAAGQATVGDQPGTKKYLARVNGKLIPWDDVADEAVSRHGTEILENLINRNIIQQACDEKGIVISEAEVNKEIFRIAKKFGLSVEQWLTMLQAERKLTPAQYRRDIIWPMLALRQLAGSEVEITPKDLQQAFERNYGPRVKAKAIVLDNLRRATEVWEKARANPDEFGRLAREHSVDPASRPLEGAIPPIRKFGGNDDIEKAAFKLKPGEVSGVIQTGANQFIILMCEGRTEKVVENMSEVEDILKQELQEEKTQQSVAKVFEALKESARVDNYLTHVSTGGEKKAAEKKPGAEKPGQIQQVGGTAPPRTNPKRTAAPPAEESPPSSAAPAKSGKTPPRRVPAAATPEE